jgi:hypothetical protein
LASLTGIFCIGMEKCGTSSLDAYLLRALPAVGMPGKETFFFSRHYEKGAAWFAQLFPKPSAEHKAYLDLTPSYFRSTEALDRLAAWPYDKRVFLILRHPIERAFSHYRHNIALHISKGEGVDLTAGEPHNLHAIAGDPGERELYFPSYLKTVRAFSDRFQHDGAIFLFEDYKAEPANFAEALSAFLGFDLSHHDLAAQKALNASQSVRFKRVWSPTLSQRLMRVDAEGVHETGIQGRRNVKGALASQRSWTKTLSVSECEALFERFYAHEVDQLETILGRDLSMWRRFRDLQL